VTPLLLFTSSNKAPFLFQSDASGGAVNSMRCMASEITPMVISLSTGHWMREHSTVWDVESLLRFTKGNNCAQWSVSAELVQSIGRVWIAHKVSQFRSRFLFLCLMGTQKLGQVIVIMLAQWHDARRLCSANQPRYQKEFPWPNGRSSKLLHVLFSLVS